MSDQVLVTRSYLEDTGDAIREKLETDLTYTPAEFGAAIRSIEGGITPTGTIQIATNGTHDVTEYADANVNVQPNLQSKTVNQNGTVTPDQGYDGLSSVVVNVSGGIAPPVDTILDIGATLYVTWAVNGAGTYVNAWALEYLQENIGAGAWVDSLQDTPMVLSGNYSLLEGEALVITGEHGCYVPVTKSDMFIEMKFSIDENFTPRSAAQWYNCSCIVGSELYGTQKDFGAIINYAGYLCFGYQTSSIMATSVYLLDGQEHVLKIAWDNRNIHMECDGAYLGSVSGGSSSGEITQLGVMWNKNNANTYVMGTVSELKVGYTA